jgi:nucleoid-associated protein YgaU
MPVNPIEPTAELPTIEVAEATPVETAPSIALPTSHTVVSGDTLGSIALNYYGKSSKWRNIRDANSDVLKGSIKLSLGMELTVPALAE